MATGLLVENYVDAGQQFLDALRSSGFDVTTAFWVRTSEDDLWFLYIASPAADKGSLAKVYSEVYRILQALRSSWVSESDVKLIGASNPITLDVIRLRDNWPGTSIVKRDGLQLGSMFVEEVHIYPNS